MAEGAGGALVLVVEDNAANLLLVRVVLARGGYRVAEAGSVAEAERAIRAVRPDVVLMDLGLPDGDGLDLARRLKEDAATAGIPVIAVTAHAMAADAERARAAGCHSLITKPIDTRTFAAQVGAALPAGSGSGR